MSSTDKPAGTIGFAKATLLGLGMRTTLDADPDKQTRLRKVLIQDGNDVAKDRQELERSRSRVRETRERFEESIEARHNTLDERLPLSLASMPVTARQRKLAYATILILGAGLVPTAFFATVALPRLNAFIPSIQAVAFVADLITAYFLFTHYSIEARRALLALAGGYMFSGLFALMQSLEFPGAYSATGLLGGGPSGASWMFIFWHTTFASAVTLYLLLSSRQPAVAHATPRAALDITVTIVIVCVIVGGLTWLGTAGNDHLPDLVEPDFAHQTPVSRYLSGITLCICLATLACLLIRTRTVLDVWLTVTLCAALPNIAQGVLFAAPRYTVLWYVTRCFTLIASWTVLAVVLTETTTLYTRLSSAILAQRRERINRLLSIRAATAALGHEVRQPLSVIALESATALAMLDGTPPNLQEARDALKSVEAAAARVGDVLTSTRAVFERDAQARVAIDLNELTRQVLQIIHHDLTSHGVTVTVSYGGGLPPIKGDRTQLQQVLLNLIRNAIEAMEGVQPAQRHLRLATRFARKTAVVLSIEDTGPGIAPTEQPHIFEAFHTTKPTGSGLGLAICQSIIEEHHGTLRLAKAASGGCVFEIALPVDEGNSAPLVSPSVVHDSALGAVNR